jgi:hypothetical protein
VLGRMSRVRLLATMGPVTNPSQSAEGQSGPEVNVQAEPVSPQPPPPPPDRSWIEFDIGIRNQDPGVVEHRVIQRGD